MVDLLKMTQHDVYEGKMCAHRLCALDLWWLVRVIIVDLEGEPERATLIHAYRGQSESAALVINAYSRTLVGTNGESEVEKVIGIREMCLHRRW